MRVLKSKVIALLMATSLLLAAGGSSAASSAGSPIVVEATPSGGPSADLAAALGGDGTFRGAAGVGGRVDRRVWNLVSDVATGERPRFAPAASPVSASAIGWSALGSNGAGNGALNLDVQAIAVSGTDLYVGGFFTDAAGIATADYIAKWNGTTWSAVGSNGAGNGALNGAVRALAVSGTDLYVAGDFTNAAGIAEGDYVAKWNGSAWSALGSNGAGIGAIHGIGPGQNVSGLAVSGADLYVSGGFSDAAGIAEADYIAKWNGSAWSALGSNGAGDGAIGYGCVPGLCYQPNVTTLEVSGTDVYVGGFFSNAAGLATADDIAKWDGIAWSALGSNGAGNGAILLDDGSSVYAVNALTISGTDLYVGGSFNNAAGISIADRIARWSGTAWSAMGSTSPPISGVNAMAVSGSNLYVAGGLNVGGVSTAAVVTWNGSAWSTLSGTGNGVVAAGQTNVFALGVSGTALYVGGFFANVGGIAAADYLAKWGEGATVVIRQPDGRIRLGTGAFVGNNVYNATGIGQTRRGSARRGHSVTFGMSIQNDGTSADRFRIKATGPSRSAYIVKYFRGTTDITRAVVGGTYRTPSLAPGGAYVITARVTVRWTAALGSGVTRVVTITSVANSTRKDAVRFVGLRR